MTLITEDEVLDARIAALPSAAEGAVRPDLVLRVRHFAGTFGCCKCGVQGPVQAVGPLLARLFRACYVTATQAIWDELPKFVAWARLSAAGDRRTVAGRIVVTAKDHSNATDTNASAKANSVFRVVGSATGNVNRARSNSRSNSEFGTANQCLQLGPGDLGMAAAAEAAIGAGHHILRPHETAEAADALSH
jgi:hypothetical protein